MVVQLTLLVTALAAPPGATPAGSIAGMVVNASRDNAPVAGAEVVLRVRVEGQFVVAGETRTNAQGRYLFDDLPADPAYVYLAGANWQSVHYPGRRVQLSNRQQRAHVDIAVCDAVESPSPLVVRDHQITIAGNADALRVTETLVIDNPGNTTYVGLPKGDSKRAATLSLSIPSEFVRTTFDEEFFGKNFVLIDGKLVTDVPWTPGQRTVGFTYVLPTDQKHRTWERPLDLPTDSLRVTATGPVAAGAVCSLKPVADNTPAEDTDHDTAVVFSGEGLAAGEVVRVELGALPMQLTAYARWGALAVLAGLIAATVVSLRRRKIGGGTETAEPPTAAASPAPPQKRAKKAA